MTRDQYVGRYEGEACARKKPYASEGTARTAARMLQRRRAKKDRLNVYLCGVCHLWHVGHVRD